MSDWRTPVSPVLTDSLIIELIEEHNSKGPKPKAFDTKLRFSSAGDCSRALGYQALDYPVTNEFDAPAIWVTTLGTEIHEWVQDAIGRRYPGAVFEPKGRIGNITSGSSDGVLDNEVLTAVIPDWQGGRALFELKTMGGFAFEKSIGLKRRTKELSNPEGPRISAVLQAALNAYTHDCDTLIIGAIALEAVSKATGAGAGLDEIGRFVAEWHIPKAVWSSWAEAEIRRQENLVDAADQGWLSKPVIVEGLNDDGTLELKSLDPTAARPYWKCDYCAYKQTCIADGNGIVEVER